MVLRWEPRSWNLLFNLNYFVKGSCLLCNVSITKQCNILCGKETDITSKNDFWEEWKGIRFIQTFLICRCFFFFPFLFPFINLFIYFVIHFNIFIILAINSYLVPFVSQDDLTWKWSNFVVSASNCVVPITLFPPNPLNSFPFGLRWNLRGQI